MKALIAMSGGVDSSTAAYLMQKDGYECEGVTMRLYHNEDVGVCTYHTCCSEKDIDDAADVAYKLDIPYEVVDYVDDFEAKVIDKFVRTYEAGGTPNPCIDCNKYMKFDKLLEEALKRGDDYIVTGHYARVEKDETTGRFLLKKAADLTKDQSYVLYNLTQDELSHIKFPLGEMTKNEARDIAEAQGFVNARKHDSEDICFVPDGDYVKFMEQYTGKKYPEGNFIDPDGNVIGKHRGAVRYTIGQRKGLGIAAGHPIYVCAKDMKANTVTVGEHDRLFSRRFIADTMNWISTDGLKESIHCKCKARYRQVEQPCVVNPLEDGRIEVIFDEPQRAVTVGQAAVLYDGDIVIGGGTIAEVGDLS